MLTAISRYGVRVVSEERDIVRRCIEQRRFVEGPEVAEFEKAFAARLGADFAVATSYGRMAFYHILKALNLPPGAEIVVPAFTFWVIPELARTAGLRVVFADIDPDTFTLAPAALERAISPATRVVVPTHLFGLPCDMNAVMELARRHRLMVVEDCAHALGATYAGRQVGTFGDAALFSFQTLKLLNTYGGGMAVVRDPTIAQRLAAQIAQLPWPSEQRVRSRLRVGQVMRFFTRASVFTLTAFPILWATSCFKANPDVYLWEPIRRLDPLPPAYTERFSNVQAAIGLAALERLSGWTEDTRRNAQRMTQALAGLAGVQTPHIPSASRHVYYQFCVYVPNRDVTVRRCIRRGVDLETLHVDVCTRLPLFADEATSAPGADRASQAIQVPVYASLTDPQLNRIARTIRRVVSPEHDRRCDPAADAHDENRGWDQLV